MNKKIIIIYLCIGCLLAALSWWSYRHTEKQMLEVAERTFVEAVHQDLEERWKASGENIHVDYDKGKKVYTNLYMQSNNTNKSISIKGIDYSSNIDDNIHYRMLHTIALDFSLECQPDTLLHIWESLLLKSRIETPAYVVVSNSGKSIPFLRDSLSINASYKPLPIFYAGIRNEIQLNGFIQLSSYNILNYYPLLWIYLCLLFTFLLFNLWKIIYIFINSSTHSKGGYQLSNDVIYHPNLRCFIKGRKKINLTPKGNLIIKTLLEAENHQLHGAELLAKVWEPSETNMNKLYIQNTKLRSVLKGLGDGFDIVSIDRSHFLFVFPNS